jgi:parallel beta helix pectate lyase-like protein
MKRFLKFLSSRSSLMALSITTLALVLAISLSTNSVSANHPVLVEGNCDSPVPGTTLVAPGTCGDFDGDGRIGTAEDTDGADRIFGTLRAALGPGTGAAAGTGANHNGAIMIVTSGRFAETLFIGNSGIVVGEGVASPGNVTIEAAPGVDADINAVLQGDPAGGNVTRQGQIGIQIAYTATGSRVILRNLTIRNFAEGVRTQLNASVTIDHCRFENNLNYAIRAQDASQVAAFKTRIEGTGFRIGGGGTPTPGTAVRFEDTSSGSIYHSQITGNLGQAIVNASTLPPTPATAVTYYEVFLGMNNASAIPGGVIVNATRESTP